MEIPEVLGGLGSLQATDYTNMKNENMKLSQNIRDLKKKNSELAEEKSDLDKNLSDLKCEYSELESDRQVMLRDLDSVAEDCHDKIGEINKLKTERDYWKQQSRIFSASVQFHVAVPQEVCASSMCLL